MSEGILRDLAQPEYLHTLLNPLPVYGLAVALFGLLSAMYLRSRGGRRIALILVFATAAAAWPVAHYGDQGYDRVLSMADEAGAAWLKAHASRGDWVPVYYFLALVAAAAIFAPVRWPKLGTPLAVATLVLGFCSLGIGAYIAHAGGKIRHREFRNVPPPAAPAESER